MLAQKIKVSLNEQSGKTISGLKSLFGKGASVERVKESSDVEPTADTQSNTAVKAIKTVSISDRIKAKKGSKPRSNENKEFVWFKWDFPVDM